MPTLRIVNNYSRKFTLRVFGDVLGLVMVNDNNKMTQKEKNYLTGALVKAEDGRKGIVEIIKNERLYIESEDGTRFDISYDELEDVLESAEDIEQAQWERNQMESL